MKPETKPIYSAIILLRDRLKALREFTKYVEPHLAEGYNEVLKSNQIHLAPMLLFMHQIERETFALTEEAKAKLTSICGDEVKFEEVEKEGKKEWVMKMPPDKSEKLSEAMNRLHTSREQRLQLYESALVSLVSTIEVFFAKLLHIYFTTRDSIPSGKEKVFSYDDLKQIGSISEAKEVLIEGRIEDILRGAFPSWIKIVKDSLELGMGYVESHMDTLTEACLRRNLIVHNGTIVNKIYMNRVPVSKKPGAAIGDKLVVERECLDNVLETFELTCSLVGFEYWKRLELEDHDRGELIVDYIFDSLCEGRYELCESLARFLIGDKKQSDEHITIGQLNLWLSIKKRGKWVTIAEEHKKADYSAKSLRFRTAHAALGDDVDEFFRLARLSKQSADFSAKEFKDFPIFDFYRGDARFKRIVSSKTKPKTKD